jgi:hypothetical protein
VSKPILWPTPPDGPSDPAYVLRRSYHALRASCYELEKALGGIVPGSDGLAAKDIKRLDKAVTIMKVGFKLAKKALKERKPAAHPEGPADRASPRLLRLPAAIR